MYGLKGERLATYTFGVNSTTYVINGQLFVFRYGTTTLSSRNVYFAGRLIRSNGQTALTDRLGSVRAKEAREKVVYYPYGEQQSGNLGDDREKFATYTRDTAVGPDYANQRWYAGVYGRFNTADPYDGSAQIGNPTTTLNRYNYVLGDPANFNDPSGLAGGGGCGDGGDGLCDIDTGAWGESLPGWAGPQYAGGTGFDTCAWNPYDASCGSFPGWAMGLAPTPQTVGQAIGTAIGGIGIGVGRVLNTVLTGIFFPAPLGGTDEVVFENARKRDLQFYSEALRRYARRCGKYLDIDQATRVHDAIHGLGYDQLDQIVEMAIDIFGCPAEDSRGGGSSGGGLTRPPGGMGGGPHGPGDPSSTPIFVPQGGRRGQ